MQNRLFTYSLPSHLYQKEETISDLNEQVEIRVSVKEYSPENLIYFEILNELEKNKIKFVNDVLRACMSLSASLCGGAIIFLNGALVSENIKLFIAISFTASLVSSVFGVLPMSVQYYDAGFIDDRKIFFIFRLLKNIIKTKVFEDNDDNSKKIVNTIFQYKLIALHVWHFFLLLGLVIASFGVFLKR